MTPEQIKKHEPMNINNLYEAVPCKNFENILESDYHVQLEENRRDESIKLAADKYLTESYRPVPRERVEEALRELLKDKLQSFGEKVWDISGVYHSNLDEEVPDKQTAITELINKTLNPSPEDKN